jgi:hypothetical protein
LSVAYPSLTLKQHVQSQWVGACDIPNPYTPGKL